MIYALEFAQARGLDSVWLEVDSTYIASLLQVTLFLVPWWVKAHWCRVLSYVADIRFVVLHICREAKEKMVANAVAALGMK